MKNIIAAILVTLPMTVMASEWFQSNKPVTCGPFREIVETLTKERFKEFPLWVGHSSEDRTKFILFYNDTTGAWTLVQIGQTTGCILGLGERSDIVDGKLLPDSKKF